MVVGSIEAAVWWWLRRQAFFHASGAKKFSGGDRCFSDYFETLKGLTGSDRALMSVYVDEVLMLFSEPLDVENFFFTFRQLLLDT